MLYPLSYRGVFSTAWHVNTSKIDVNRTFECKCSKQKEIARGGDLFFGKTTDENLSRACVFLGFGVHATTVQCIVDDLAHCRSFWINVHSVARFQMPDNTLGRYLERDAIKL